MRMFHFARIRILGSLEQLGNQLATKENRMSMLALIFRNYSPFPARRGSLERVHQFLERFALRWRTIHQSDDGSIAPAVQNLLQADSQGAELPALGFGIHHQRRAAGIHNGSQLGFILAHDDEDFIHEGREETDRSREERVGSHSSSDSSRSGCRTGVRGRPRQQRLVAAHARRLARCQNHSAKSRRSSHEGTIANWRNSAKDAPVARCEKWREKINSYLKVGSLTRSSWGTRSTGCPALRQARSPPAMTNTLNPISCSWRPTRALVASRCQVQ